MAVLRTTMILCRPRTLFFDCVHAVRVGRAGGIYVDFLFLHGKKDAKKTCHGGVSTTINVQERGGLFVVELSVLGRNALGKCTST